MVTAGPVTLTNITVDGTGGGGGGCAAQLAGIYYASGSAGTINEVTTRNHINSGCSYGILVDNSSSTSESITIQNSSVHDVDGVGIRASTNEASPTLTATVKSNTVDSGSIGIVTIFVAGSVTGNVVSSVSTALDLIAPAAASGNTITNSSVGILASGAGVVANSNKISNSSTGIVIGAVSGTFQSNTITRTTTGVEFNCNAATVMHNTINDATVGLADVPASYASVNKFFNVNTIRTDGCPMGPAHSVVQAGRLPIQAMPR